MRTRTPLHACVYIGRHARLRDSVFTVCCFRLHEYRARMVGVYRRESISSNEDIAERFPDFRREHPASRSSSMLAIASEKVAEGERHGFREKSQSEL